VVTLIGILMGVVAIILIPPPWAIVVVAFMGVCVWETWRFVSQVRARRGTARRG
jgi:uncharacterized membrane protein YccC